MRCRFLEVSGIRLAVSTALAGIAGLGILGYLGFSWRLHYPDVRAYPVRGVDVSHHQGKISWEKLAAQRIRFAYIKATEGGDFQDHEFRANWEGTARSGIARGAYHFFSLCKPGDEQARNFIKTVPLEPGALPPAVDFEFMGNCKARPPREDVLREFFAFSRAVESRYGALPIIYVTGEAYERYLEGQVDPYRLWVRGIVFKPRLSSGRVWSFWQYSHHARLDGIRGRVDMNVFNGSPEEFERQFPAARISIDK
ncbi:MAG TPA: lysozyme [Elusimicrobia bacterium]|nr:lysozyme [Elusimicrobiota bacterium]HBT60424.1 lysozyme [Elusimicrobiota bacterium]